MSLGLEINIEEISSKIVLRLVGRIDAKTAPTLQNKIEVLLKEGYKNINLDFSNISYLSSAGLRVLISSTKELEKEKGRLTIFSVLDNVYEIIKLTGFEKILNIYKNEKQALTS
ncbi:MAG: Anti-sigma F factor antagonist [Candidatus Anoxychlamydiales bacterium]|nr:Anti-sigma F factor antagonist [Candidatus Anoxychlamydiales bacterium]